MDKNHKLQKKKKNKKSIWATLLPEQFKNSTGIKNCLKKTV